MPLYVYKNKEGEELLVLRSINDYQVPPTQEEIDKAKKTGAPEDWTRIIEPPRTTGKESWRNKGFHAILLAGGIIHALSNTWI